MLGRATVPSIDEAFFVYDFHFNFNTVFKKVERQKKNKRHYSPY